MDFIKKEWFKIGILIIAAIFLVIFYYNFKAPVTLQQPIVIPNEEIFPPTNEKKEVIATTSQNFVPIKNEISKPKFPERITSQIIFFDDFLEYKIIGTDLDCVALVVYNNAAKTGSMDAETFKTAFPEIKEYYQSTCQKEYLDMSTNMSSLVAEPELKTARKIITDYAEVVRTFSQYALGGGYEDSILNSYEIKVRGLRTDAREEILKLKQEYDIKN